MCNKTQIRLLATQNGSNRFWLEYLIIVQKGLTLTSWNVYLAH
jgi:hypothetical protein